MEFVLLTLLLALVAFMSKAYLSEEYRSRLGGSKWWRGYCFQFVWIFNQPNWFVSCNSAGMLQIGVALSHGAQRSPTALAVASSAVLILHAYWGRSRTNLGHHTSAELVREPNCLHLSTGGKTCKKQYLNANFVCSNTFLMQSCY